MCTSIKFNNCMGRNYDYEQSYDETITIIPKHKHGNEYSMIGVCTGFVTDYPLWYDVMNECGLCISALAFKGNAHYGERVNGKHNMPPYKFINYICGNFSNVESVREELETINIVDEPYSEQFPNTDLHWLICDKNDCITVETTKNGLRVYDNPYGVLTNNPPFDRQCKETEQMDRVIGTLYYPGGICESRGTETVGVKGDTTSMSRFHRIHYYKEQMKKKKNRVCSDDVSTFHLLGTVEQTYGATPVGDSYEYTIYSAVYDMLNLELAIKPYSNTGVKRFSLVNRERRYKL